LDALDQKALSPRSPQREEGGTILLSRMLCHAALEHFPTKLDCQHRSPI
jgi:hypothetical protein